MLGYLAADSLLRLVHGHNVVTTNDPVIAEDYAMLQPLLTGRVDLMLAAATPRGLNPGSGRTIRNDGHPLAIETTAAAQAVGARTGWDWTGRFRLRCIFHRNASRWRASAVCCTDRPRSNRSRASAYYCDAFFAKTTIFLTQEAHTSDGGGPVPERFAPRSLQPYQHRWPGAGKWFQCGALAGLVAEFRPSSTNAPVVCTSRRWRVHQQTAVTLGHPHMSSTVH